MRCGFIGHRDAEGIEDKICEEIKKLMASGVGEFYSGGMGNFDIMCEKAVKSLKGRLVFIPYSKKQIKITSKLYYDDIICPLGDKEYSKYDIPKRNRWLVDNCDIFLCFVNKSGGAMNTLDYAVKKGKKIIDLTK